MTTSIGDLQVDPPAQLKGYGSLLDRRYIDDQILGVEQHLIDSLLINLCRWFVVDSSVVGTLASPTCVAMAGTDTAGNPTVIKATSTNAKFFVGIALTSAQALSKIRVVTSGILPPSVTGIANGGVAGYAIVDPTSGQPTYAASLSSSDTVVGRVNAAGMLTVLGANIVGAADSVTGGAQDQILAVDGSDSVWVDVTGDITMTVSGGLGSVSVNRATGKLNFTTAPTTTSAPSAGGAGALPATPTGYMTIQVAGVDRKVAYY